MGSMAPIPIGTLETAMETCTGCEGWESWGPGEALVLAAILAAIASESAVHLVESGRHPEFRTRDFRRAKAVDHMFFMRFPVDVAFIDAEGKVVRLYHGLRPWRISRVVRRAKAAIELPSGSLARAGVGVGDLLTMS